MSWIPTADQCDWLIDCLNVIGGQLPCAIISGEEFSGKTELLARLCAGILCHSPVPYRVTVMCCGELKTSHFRDKTIAHAQDIDPTTFEEVTILYRSFHDLSVVDSDADLIIIDDADKAPLLLLASVIPIPHILAITCPRQPSIVSGPSSSGEKTCLEVGPSSG